MSQLIRKILILFVWAFFAIDAKITFKESELPQVFGKRIQISLKKIAREFTAKSKTVKEQLLNMIIIAFIGNDLVESLMNADEKTQEEFKQKIQSFFSNLAPETSALQQLIGEAFNTIMTKEMEKGKDGYFGSINSKEDFDLEFAKLSVTYQLVVYDELYNALTTKEQEEFCDILSIANGKKHSKIKTKKVLPKPEDLYALLNDTIKRALKFMGEIAQLAASSQEDVNN